jgi:hypothetical protein
VMVVLLGLVSFGLELMLNYIESQVSVFLLLSCLIVNSVVEA